MSSLSHRIASTGRTGGHVVAEDADGCLTLADVAALAPSGDPSRRPSPVVALSIVSPIKLVRALIALDGGVAGLLLLSPELRPDAVGTLMAETGATHLLSDRPDLSEASLPDHASLLAAPERDRETIWSMTTSGTTGMPKVTAHTLAALGGRVRPSKPSDPARRWGLLYEPSRFAGLQVVLQALIGGDTLLATGFADPIARRISRLVAAGCTHLSATPSIFRKILMVPEADRLLLTQITLAGEIASDGLLTALKARFPSARITHVFGATETGVVFSVKDGRAGFPVEFLEPGPDRLEMKIVEGLLWARPRTGRTEPGGSSASRHVLRDADGFVCLRDRVRIVEGRVQFLGREGSSINVGGTKVQLEDVEAVLMTHPGVAECQCEARPNAIVGHLLTLRIVTADPAADPVAFKADLKAWCRTNLPREAQPADIRIVSQIATNAAGKISRRLGV